jgi:predicted Zn-dependent protease
MPPHCRSFSVLLNWIRSSRWRRIPGIRLQRPWGVHARRRKHEQSLPIARSRQRAERTGLREAFFGNADAAQEGALAALKTSKGRDVEYGVAITVALSGDFALARRLTSDLEMRFPEDTAIRSSYLPTLRALILIHDGHPAKALDTLQNAAPYELGQPPSSFSGFFGVMYPVYVRGQAYLQAHRSVEAASKFQKTLDHRTVVITDPIGALAELQLARAQVLAGDRQSERFVPAIPHPRGRR